MEKKLVLAIALSTLVLILYYAYMEPTVPARREGEEVTPREHPRPVEEERQEGTKPPVEEMSPLPVPLEGEDIIVETELYRLVLTTCGAKIKSFRLKGYPELWKTEKELKKEIDTIERNLSRNRGNLLEAEAKLKQKSGDIYVEDLERKRDRFKRQEELLIRSREILLYVIKEREKRKLRAGELEDEIKEASLRGDYESELELAEELKVERGVELVPSRAQLYGNYLLTLSFPNLNVDFDNILFSYNVNRIDLVEDREATLELDAEVEGVRVKKVFTFTQGAYVVGLDVIVENRSRASIRDERAMLLYGPGMGLVEETQMRVAVKRIASYIKEDGNLGKVRFENVEARRPDIPPGKSVTHTGDLGWVALRNKYFAAVLIPPPECREIRLENLADGGQRVGVKLPPFNLNSGQSSTTTFEIYFGPQRVEDLRRVGKSLEKIVDYGFWGPISKLIHRLLKVFFGVVKNYGWSIIMLSLFIKVIFYPLTHRSFAAMQKMQDDMKELQPKMNELKEKHKGNQQKLNKAMMELYRKEGKNPLRGCGPGCFPMLLQMPVFFALYTVFYNAIDLRGAHFLGWITDLSSPDPKFVLPILMGASMFWQQKLTGMGGAAMGATAGQQDQQKMMKWMMPAFLTYIFFKLPAGLVLYWLSFNIFTGLQQFLIMKKKASAESSAESGAE